MVVQYKSLRENYIIRPGKFVTYTPRIRIIVAVETLVIVLSLIYEVILWNILSVTQ